MKQLLILLAFSNVLFLSAQQYCDYNAMVPVNIGDGAGTEFPVDMFILPDGKLIGVGTSYYSGSNSFEASIFRLNADNSFDQDFGVNGRIGHTWEQRNSVNCSLMREDGKIYVGGYQAPSNGISSFRAFVGRFNEDGSPDESFGDLGSVKFDFAGGVKGTTIGLNVMVDGGVMAAVLTRDPAGIGLVKLDDTGNLDTSFSEDGISLISDSQIAWQSDFGEAYFSSDNESTFFITKALVGSSVFPYIIKLNGVGTLDSTFSEVGASLLDFECVYNFSPIIGELTTDGNILVGCTNVTPPYHMRVMKVDGETGVLDSGFGEDGMSESTMEGSFQNAWGLAIDPMSQDILTVGTGSNSNRYPTVWRIDSDGNEQTSCGGDAMQIFTSNVGSQGYRCAKYDNEGMLRILGLTGVQDTTSGTGQSMNMMYAYDATPSALHENQELNFSVYPNPVENQLTIDIDNYENFKYKITDQLGRTVAMGSAMSLIATDFLNPGIYQLLLLDANGRQGVSKFVK